MLGFMVSDSVLGVQGAGGNLHGAERRLPQLHIPERETLLIKRDIVRLAEALAAHRLPVAPWRDDLAQFRVTIKLSQQVWRDDRAQSPGVTIWLSFINKHLTQR